MADGLYRRKDSPIWYALFYIHGERVRESLGTTDKRAARRKRDERRAELLAEHARARAPITWQQACIRWLNAAPRSANDRYILRGLAYADRPLSECTPESFTTALEHLTPATFNRYRAILVAICNLSGHTLQLKAAKGGKKARLRFLTADEWAALYAALPAHLKPLAHFSILTGLRQANVLALRWDQIDLARGHMWVHADEAKGGKPMGIPLAPDAVTVLKGQLGKSAVWVFPYVGRGRKKGKDAPMADIKTAWYGALARAGLGRYERSIDAAGKAHRKWVGEFTWHGLRHTWAAWHLMAGTPLKVLAELGGWADLRMVMEHYGHLASEHVAGYAANAVPWVSGLSVKPAAAG